MRIIKGLDLLINLIFSNMETEMADHFTYVEICSLYPLSQLEFSNLFGLGYQDFSRGFSTVIASDSQAKFRYRQLRKLFF